MMNVVQETPAPEIPLTAPRTGFPVSFLNIVEILKPGDSAKK